jgi:lauroyl/myristoyl acyltransferase
VSRVAEPATVPKGVRSFRASAAGFWLRALFWCTLHAPWMVRLLRPLAIAVTWRCSHKVHDAVMANAGWLLGAGASPAERAALGREVIGRFIDTVEGFARNRRLSANQLLAQIERVDGLEHYERARALRRGAVLVTAHVGPFETAVASIRQREPRVYVVFRRDVHDGFERIRSEQRARLGVTEAPVDDGLMVWMRLRDALRADEVVLVQGDRVFPGQKGAAVPFLGGHVRLPEGPVKLALATGAPIVPTFAAQTPGGGVAISMAEPIIVDPLQPGAVSPEEALRRIAAAMASHVSRYPEQWLMLEKAWCEDAAS